MSLEYRRTIYLQS